MTTNTRTYPYITPEALEALRDLRRGVEMDRHHLPDEDLRLAALDAAIELQAHNEELRTLLAEETENNVQLRLRVHELEEQADISYETACATIRRLRSALEMIATQDAHHGPDGTFNSWRHWTVIAREALSLPTAPAPAEQQATFASAEVAVWRTRFPTYEYRAMDDMVALRLSAEQQSQAERPVDLDYDYTADEVNEVIDAALSSGTRLIPCEAIEQMRAALLKAVRNG